MTEIQPLQPLQLIDVSEPSDGTCGPSGCGCGAVEAAATSAPVAQG